MLLSITWARGASAYIAAAAFLLSATQQSAGAQSPQQARPDVEAILKDTQQTSTAEKTLTIAWWIPEQFWRAAMAQNPDSSPERVEAIVKPLRGYTIVAVIDAKTGLLATLEYTPDATLAAEVSIKDRAGNIYAPLPENQIDGNTKTLLAVMKPLLTNMLGALGQNLHFFVFPAQSKDGNPIAEATKEGLFYVEVGKKEFRWKLPLGSVLPTKTCPTCKETLSGAYKYCPYDGTKLPEPASVPNPPATVN
jgi:hypothetical protein